MGLTEPIIGKVRTDRILWISMCRYREYGKRWVLSLCGIGRVSACLVEFHVQMERCMGGGSLCRIG